MHAKTILGFMAVLAIPLGSALATDRVGITSLAFRNPIKVNIYSTQWGPAPLFNLLLQTSPDTWGYDLATSMVTFAPATADGTPSQMGWHDHPVPILLVTIVQGGLWFQERPHLDCLTYYPTGSVLTEAQGNIHNAYNFDKKTATILWVTGFVERYMPATRTEEPDPFTGDPNVASPPPPLCRDSPVPPAVASPARR
jgi:hypothetical protein